MPGRGLLPLPLVDRIEGSELGYDIGKLNELNRLWRGVSSQEGSKNRNRYRHDRDGGFGCAVDLQIHSRGFCELSVWLCIGNQEDVQPLSEMSLRAGIFKKDMIPELEHESSSVVASHQGGNVKHTTRPCS